MRHALDLALQRDEATRVEHARHVARCVGMAVQHETHLDLRRRVADAHAQEEAIELGLRQRERAREVLRVLRRDDEERIGQRDGLAVERDLPFVHRLEQRRLGARAGAVDLVGQQDVREDRALAEDELAAALVVDADAEDVAREQVAGELHAAQLAADGLGDGARERRLADAGHVLDEQVAAGEERDERELDGVLLAFERTLHGLTQRLERGELRRDAGRSGHGAEGSTEGLAGRERGIALGPKRRATAPDTPTRPARPSRGVEPPPLQGDQLAAERRGEGVVVGAEDDRRASPGLLLEDPPETLGRRRVEACRGLVEEQEPRRLHQRPRQGDSLPLTARVRADRAVGEDVQLEAIRGDREGARRVAAVQRRRELDVLPPREIRIAERLVTHPPERGAHVLYGGAEVPVIDSPRGRTRHRPDDGEEGRLARSVGSPQRGQGAGRESAAHAHERADRTVGLRDIL